MYRKILISILFFCFYTFPGVTQSAVDSSTLLKKGDVVPDLAFEISPGKTVHLSDYRGKVILLNFFATWCPPCNAEYPYLQKDVWEKYRNDPHFALFSFGREHNWKEVTSFAKKKQVSFPVLPDSGRKIFSIFAQAYIPRNIVLDEEGKIIYESVGYSPDDFQKLRLFLAQELSSH